MSVGQKENSESRQESNPWPPEHRAPLYPLSYKNSWRARSLIHRHISLLSIKFTIFINLSNLRYIVYILYIFIAIRDVGDIVKEMFGDSPPSIVMMGHR